MRILLCLLVVLAVIACGEYESDAVYTYTCTGTVLDNATSVPIANASISLKTTYIYDFSDFKTNSLPDGTFSITYNAGLSGVWDHDWDGLLTVHAAGYQTNTMTNRHYQSKDYLVSALVIRLVK